jgi:lipopolysaccharide export system protein LptA
MRHFGNSILSLSCLAVSAISALPVSGQDNSDKANLASEDDLLGANFAKMPPMPKSLHIEHDGSIHHDAGKQTILYQGKVIVTGDNGITIKAEHALINTQSETATLKGQVVVRQKSTTLKNGKIIPGIQLFADKALLNAATKTIVLSNNVTIYQASSIHRGDHATYNYATGQLNSEGLASGYNFILMESNRFQMVNHKGKKVFIGDNAGITTHDAAEPNYWIRSDRTSIYTPILVITSYPGCVQTGDFTSSTVMVLCSVEKLTNSQVSAMVRGYFHIGMPT